LLRQAAAAAARSMQAAAVRKRIPIKRFLPNGLAILAERAIGSQKRIEASFLAKGSLARSLAVRALP